MKEQQAWVHCAPVESLSTFNHTHWWCHTILTHPGQLSYITGGQRRQLISVPALFQLHHREHQLWAQNSICVSVTTAYHHACITVSHSAGRKLQKATLGALFEKLDAKLYHSLTLGWNQSLHIRPSHTGNVARQYTQDTGEPSVIVEGRTKTGSVKWDEEKHTTWIEALWVQ